MSGRWWRSEFASLGMAMPAPGWALRQGDLKCGLWDGWWPAPARERRAVEALCWDLEDVGGCVGLVWGLVDVAPLVEEVVIGDGDEQRDQDGLGDAPVGEPVLRITQVEVVALETAVQPFRHRPGSGIRPSPRRAEVGQILAELVEVAEVAGVQGDGVLVADLRQFTGLMVGDRGQDAGFGRWVGGSLPGVGQVDRGGPAGPALVEAVEAGAGEGRGGACCRALEADGAAGVRALFETQQVRLSRGDQRGEFFRWSADDGVVQAGGGVREPFGRQRAGQGAVDEQRAVGTALHSPLIHFVIECEAIAEFACGLGEVAGLLIGVGAVDDGEGGGETERGQGFQGGDGVGADAFVWGVENQAERQLRERAGNRAGAGGDGEGGAVAVLGWAVSGGVVPSLR
jgi:hypothetical protein